MSKSRKIINYKVYKSLRLLCCTVGLDTPSYELFRLYKRLSKDRTQFTIKCLLNRIYNIQSKYNIDISNNYSSLTHVVDHNSSFKNDNRMTEDTFIHICNSREDGEVVYRMYCRLKTLKFRPKRLDTRSLDFCIERYGERGYEIYKQRCFDAGKNVRVQYWLDQGYSLEESKRLLKERQSTGRLDKFQDRYGEEEGLRRWRERQVKWQNTLKSKPQEEIDDINRRKSSGIGAYESLEVPGKLYYIHFFNEEISFWKIGITIHSLFERFNLHTLEARTKLRYNIIALERCDTIREAYSKEQLILKEFNSKRISINYNGFISSECFSDNVLSNLLSTQSNTQILSQEQRIQYN